MKSLYFLVILVGSLILTALLACGEQAPTPGGAEATVPAPAGAATSAPKAVTPEPEQSETPRPVPTATPRPGAATTPLPANSQEAKATSEPTPPPAGRAPHLRREFRHVPV